MITIRRSEDRGHANHGWLDSYHTFSFANYYDPRHVQFRSLRVINEDRIAPGAGFPTHPHRNMEIITYVITGSLSHKDSIGNGETIGARGVQRFSAGTGITHSEFNPSNVEATHLLQIWIVPEQTGITPSYEQKDFASEVRSRHWVKLASRDASDGSVKIHQDASIFAVVIDVGKSQTYELEAARNAWVQVVQGEVSLNGHTLYAGDAAAIQKEAILNFDAIQETELLLFDLA